jgi:hypothetical protein
VSQKRDNAKALPMLTPPAQTCRMQLRFEKIIDERRQPFDRGIAAGSQYSGAADARPGRSHRMLNDSVEAIRQLRHQTNIIPIPGRDALIYIRTVAAGADHAPMEEWRHALLHAAEMIRDLNIVLDSGTMVTLVDPKQWFKGNGARTLWIGAGI